MLTHTFCHLPGIGATTEARLWAAGVTTWEDLRAPRARLPVSFREGWAQLLDESCRHHADGNPDPFGRMLPAACQWRLYHDYRHACAFVDVETTGLAHGDPITTIALFDGRHLRTYVRGRNLADFARDIRDYR